ncbi:MAG TPA: VOC family protein [Bryobacteraceae bacterium]|nr:VOC family protein [Bryobacteraceae bacterium]
MRGLLFLAFTLPAMAQLPEFYKHVDHVVWLVKDLNAVAAAWDKNGFGPVTKFDDEGVATARLKNVEINWMQPGTNGPMADHLKSRGEGVFSLVHRVPTLEALKAEEARLGALGVKVLQRMTLNGGQINVVFFDTAPQGKYVIGLVHGTEDAEPAASAPAVSQFAFVARDTRAISAYWAKLGWPEMTYTHGGLRDLEYRGQPGKFDQELGWQRHGKVVYEWIKPLAGPTVYEDSLKIHGEGFHHFGMDVPDMDQAIAAWKKLGYSVSQAGGWGEVGKKGSGRFAYIDTEAAGGITIELLWNQR